MISAIYDLSEPYLFFQSLHNKGLVSWSPPLTLMLDSEGIILRLDSATTLYQKPFRGSRQVTSLVRCRQDHISFCDSSVLSKYYKDNLFTNKISVFLNYHKPHFVVAFEITKII